MLFGITGYCRMGCSHCYGSYDRNGKHMTMEVVEQSINFIKKIQPFAVLVTGGEPFDHPQIFEIIDKLLKVISRESVIIASNGMFLDDAEFAKKVLELGITIQITNDPRYYPMKINKINHPNLQYTDRIMSLYPQGRASINNMIPENTRTPKCFNLRSIAINNTNNLRDAIKILEMNGKLCTPSIHADGRLYAGESRLCGSFGHVSMPLEELYKNLTDFKCNRCGMEDKLPEKFLNAIYK